MNLTVFPAKEANVNAFIFSDSKGTLIVDCTRNSKEAHELATMAKSKGTAPQQLLITHGHPDHYMGMGALKQEFPKLNIVVARKEIKDDIIGFTKWMESMKWLESEPGMKPKSEQNPGGFDYENEIKVLDSNELTLPGGSVLALDTDSPPSEAAHETIIYSEELGALFASDLVYNEVHLWLGPGVTRENVIKWKSQLDTLKTKYEPMKVKVYPGHGKPTTTAIFDVDKKYIDDLIQIVKESKSEDETKNTMIKLYPNWASPEFLLVQSIRFQMQEEHRSA